MRACSRALSYLRLPVRRLVSAGALPAVIPFDLIEVSDLALQVSNML